MPKAQENGLRTLGIHCGSYMRKVDGRFMGYCQDLTPVLVFIRTATGSRLATADLINICSPNALRLAGLASVYRRSLHPSGHLFDDPRILLHPFPEPGILKWVITHEWHNLIVVCSDSAKQAALGQDMNRVEAADAAQPNSDPTPLACHPSSVQPDTPY